MTARILVTLVAVAGLAVPGAQSAIKTADTTLFAQAASPLPIPADSTTSGAAGQPATPPAAATPPADATPPAAATPPADGETDPNAAPGTDAAPDAGSGAGQNDNSDSPDNEPLSLGEIPTIETMELTPDIAKRALDSYIMAKTKYADTDLDQYENLQDFVDQTEDGKKFEADVKAAGFANVTDWNLAVTTLGLTYSSITDDQTSDLQQQIKEVQDDKDLAQDMKDKMIKALNALIPSDNNKKIIQDLMNDPVSGPKIKQLDVEEE
jgi:hypothetical protein